MNDIDIALRTRLTSNSGFSSLYEIGMLISALIHILGIHYPYSFGGSSVVFCGGCSEDSRTVEYPCETVSAVVETLTPTDE